MELRHQFTVPSGVEEVWGHFQDIAEVAQCFPGAQVTSAEGDSFSGQVKVKLGPIAMVYTGSGTFVENDEQAKRFVVEAKGRDKRGNGTAGATVTLSMSGQETSTDVEVLTDLAITGKPAQFGRGVMQDVSDKLLGQFVDCLEQRLGAGGAPAAPSASPAPDAAAPAAPSTPAEPAAASAPPSSSGSSGGLLAAGGGSGLLAASGGAGVGGAGSAAGADAGAGRPASSGGLLAAGGGASVGPVDTSTASAESSSAAAASSSGASGSGTSGSGASARGSDEALDLGSTVLPALARAYWKEALGAVVVLAVLRRLLG